MSISIPTTLAIIQGAARIAGEAAQHARDAVGFEETLRLASSDPRQAAGSEAGETNQKLGFDSQLRELIDSIGNLLSVVGIELDANQPLQISVDRSGRLRVESGHNRASEIEARLNSDPKLVSKAKSLSLAAFQSGNASTDEPVRLVISRDLTSPKRAENILQSLGGYPNW